MDIRKKELEKISIGISIMFGLYWIYSIFISPKIDINPIINSIIRLFILYGVGLFLFKETIKKIPNTKIKESSVSIKTLIICFLLQFSVFIFFTVINWISVILSTIISGKEVAETGAEMVNNLGQLSPSLLFMLIIFSPIVEEFVFRKLYADKLLKHSELFYIQVSSFSFAIVHGVSIGLTHIIYTYLLALIWSYLYVRTGSLKWPIVLHSLSNVFNGIIQMFIMERFTFEILKIYMILVAILAIIGVIAFIRNKNIINIDGDNKLFDKNLIKEILSNKGIIFYVFVTIIMMVLSNIFM